MVKHTSIGGAVRDHLLAEIEAAQIVWCGEVLTSLLFVFGLWYEALV